MRRWWWLCVLLASCASAPRPPPTTESAGAPAREALPSREAVVAYARRYVALMWTARPEHVFHGPDHRGTRVDTPDANYLKNGWLLGENVGVPYAWGGFDSPEDFQKKLDQGWPAGHVERSRQDRGSWYTAGIDCSGMVSRSWGLSRKYSTRELPSISVRLARMEDLLPGDIVEKSGVHVMLFARFDDVARTRLDVIEAGAWDASAWKVVESSYAKERLEADGFVPMRDARRGSN